MARTKRMKGSTNSKPSYLGRVIRLRRLTAGLTLAELAARSLVSPSHLCRIERGQSFPSTMILRKIAKPLGFDELELLYMAAKVLTEEAQTTRHAGTISAIRKVSKNRTHGEPLKENDPEDEGLGCFGLQ